MKTPRRHLNQWLNQSSRKAYYDMVRGKWYQKVCDVILLQTLIDIIKKREEKYNIDK